MPYTPPSVRSLVASCPESPVLSRSQSYTKSQQHDQTTATHSSRTDLPHSSSSRAYLNKHRRSPSVSESPIVSTGLSTPDTTPQEGRSSESEDETTKSYSLGHSHQIPANNHVGSTEISPPASPQTSSDEEAGTRRGRVRDVAKLAELQAAIRIIEQHRAGSPDSHASEETKQARMTLGLPVARIGTSSKPDGTHPQLSPGLSLSAGARKISHSRSSTDTRAFFDFPRNKHDSPARSVSDSESEDDDLPTKPSLIRKKSGELVRPALRASSMKRRPSSMPGTPTYSKAVHFQDNSLEHVRHFLQVDRPIAVSAGSSPVESLFEDDSEFPFGNDDSPPRSPPFDWGMTLANFPRDSPQQRVLPVRTEKVYLSSDAKFLIGSVIVRNLSFHKLVVARFTLDYWKTTSEVVAEYSSDVRQLQTDEGCDRFTFSIKLADQANLENKTMFFCVRYTVNGQEYWDNNNSVNYQVDFSKNFKPQNGKQGNQSKSSRPNNALPRSKPSQRPRSMPSFDDFGGLVNPYEFSSFPQPSAMVGESPIRLKNKPSAKDLVPDAPGRPKSSSNQQAFGNRYDFGASIHAARQAANTTPSDRSGLPLNGSDQTTSAAQSKSRQCDTENPSKIHIQPSPGAGSTVQSDLPKPSASSTEKPWLQSVSYNELIDKYCFVRSGPRKNTQTSIR